ncbi:MULTISPECIES: Hpt domain-containing protein [Actinoplanes]|uniref:Hpt domain-containing protein n=1 Tax=Actinoplanes TaxID=1865 RepID=UPI0005F2E9EF|nr:MULTISPECIES: Hpt domain-containing protein [Actinoplanes]GLY04240.1 hypothetical protein Acsp01_46190 [Actinoplanes sp. NBRC 101535]
MTAPPPDRNSRVASVRARLADLIDPVPDPDEIALVIRLLRSYAGKTPAAAEKLVGLLRAGDVARVRDHAHGMKGSATNIGANAFSLLCADVEQYARVGRLADPDSTEDLMNIELAVTLEAVTAVAADFEALP